LAVIRPRASHIASRGIDSLANKEDPLRRAKGNGAGDDVLEVIEAMPDGE